MGTPTAWRTAPGLLGASWAGLALVPRLAPPRAPAAARSAAKRPLASPGTLPKQRPPALAGLGARGAARGMASAAKAGGEAPPPPKEVKRLTWNLQENARGKQYGWVLRMLGFYSPEAKAIRASTMLYVAARKQAQRKEFQLFCGLQDDFTTGFYLECLHVWMVLVRLRKEGKASSDVKQDFFDRFWDDIQSQIHQMGVNPIALSSRIRELQNAFYGCAVAYDFSLGASDSLLAAAMYRNLYNHNCKATHLDRMTAYVRREVDRLDKLTFDEFLQCEWQFGNPNNDI